MRHRPVVPEAKAALNQFKEEIAHELGISMPDTSLTSDITSRQAGSMGGKLGGEMTKRLIERASRGMVYSENDLPPDLD